MTALLTPDEILDLLSTPTYRPAIQPLSVLCPVYDLKPSTICNWAARGLIKRYRDGYDMLEVELRLQTRDMRHARPPKVAA